MTFQTLFRQVVGDAILVDPEARRIWDEFLRTDKLQILQNACGRGHDIPDTRIGVLFNSLTYQKKHLDELMLALGHAPGGMLTDPPGRSLIVDFGAGPGTGMLAVAAEACRLTGQRMTFSYVHIDRLRHMRSLAQAFYDHDPNRTGESSIFFVPELAQVTPPQRMDWLRGCVRVVFVFSWVLCQARVDPAVLRSFSDEVAAICRQAAQRPCYLIMADANLPWCRYGELGDMLRSKVGGQLPTSAVADHVSVYLRPDGSIRQRTPGKANLQYAVGRISRGGHDAGR